MFCLDLYLHLIKMLPRPTHLITPFLSLPLLLHRRFLSLSVLLNSSNQMSSLFSLPPLSFFSDLSAFVPPVCFISGVYFSVLAIPPSLNFTRVCTHGLVSTHTLRKHACAV